MTPRRALILLIAVSGCARLVWASSIGLGHDEAYHSLFAVHRDWSYFDHPPMFSWIESIGPILFGVSSPVSLRFGFVLLFAGSTWLLARLTSRTFGERAGFWAAFAMNVSAYHTAAAGAFVLPDGPLLFFWLLTLDRMSLAIREPNRIGLWSGVGVAWGLAMLSKYHAIFLPMGMLVYVACTPSARRILRTPGPYLASLIGIAVFSPVIYWNASHHWASFLFQGGRAVAKLRFRPDSLLGAIGGQAAYLFPWIWLSLVGALVRETKTLIRGELGDDERFLLSQSMTPLLLFTAVSAIKPVLPHWALIGYVSAYPLLGRAWAADWSENPTRRRRRAILAVIAVAVAVVVLAAQYRTGFLPLDRLAPSTNDLAKIDPTADLFGWDQVASELKNRGLLDDPDLFLFTGSWYFSGHLGYVTMPSRTSVLCYSHGDARGFAFWSRPEEWVGRDGIFVSINGRATDPEFYETWFDRIEAIGSFPVERSGKTIRTIRLFRCVRQKYPFPFDYPSAIVTARRSSPDLDR